MALQTLTPAGTLRAVTFSGSPQVLLPADLATIAQAILNDENALPMSAFSGLDHRGILTIPNRFAGLRCKPGDVIAVDQFGWPILISGRAVAAGAWTVT